MTGFRPVTVFLIALLLIVSEGQMFADTFYVRTTGNDANDGSSVANAMLTIQAAVDAAVDGDVIDIGDGTYAENVSINKGLTINGPNVGLSGTSGSRGVEAVVDVTTVALSGGRHWEISTTSQVIIDGLQFRNDVAITAAGTRTILRISTHGGHIVRNSIFARAGTSSYEGNDAAARGIEIASVGSGASVEISDNRFTGNSGLIFKNANFRSAVYSNGGAGTTTISDNTFEHCRSAINSDNTTSGMAISGNTFYGNGSALSFGGTISPFTLTLTGNDLDAGAVTYSTHYNLRNAPSGFIVDATANTYGGTSVAALTLSDLFEVSARTTDRVDRDNVGFVRIKAGHVFVSQYDIDPNTTTTPSIQRAINAASAGDVVYVAPNTYNENISISKNLTLLSSDGAAATTINGSNASPLLGTVVISGTISSVTVGNTSNGFTILGIDGTPGLEKAALYIQGSSKAGLTIRGNTITARGDAGLMGEYNAGIDGIVIDNNVFDGQTFTGANPAGDGFTQQFSLINVPRQLVVLGGGKTTTNTQNITFTNNTVSGTAGGTSITDNAGSPASPHPQGNELVTLDGVGTVTVTGNTFNGTTTRYASALRLRGSGTHTVTGNTFNGSYPVNFSAETSVAATGITRAGDVFDDNTFTAASHASTSFLVPTTIAGGVTTAATGATVRVKNGTYAENVTITTSLTLQGESTANTILRGSLAPTNSAAAVLWINANNCTVQDMTISRDIGNSVADWYAAANNQGISVGQTRTGITLQRLEVLNQRNGIYVNNSQDLKILNCDIHDNRTGVQTANNVSGLVIENNAIHDNFTHGIYLWLNANPNLTNASVRNNNISGNWYSQIMANTPYTSLTTTGMLWTCNWLGTVTPNVNATNTSEPGYMAQLPSQWGGTDPGALDGEIRGIHAKIFDITPYLVNGTDNDGATYGFQPVPASCTGEGPVRVYSDLAETMLVNSYFTISDALADASTLAGFVVRVSAGTYAEDLVVNKSVHLRGPNYGISATSGGRVPEAVIHPATINVWGENIAVNADDVTIDGFTINGDNPLLTSGYVNVTAADIDAAEAITAYYGGTDRLMVTNNIIANYFYTGVTIYPYYTSGSFGTGTASSGHVIADNRISDLGTYDATSGADFWGIGVLLYNNAYAAVEGNTIENVRTGIQTGNFYRPTPDPLFSHGIRGNSITARRRGIFHNLAYSNAVAFAVEDNTIAGVYDVNEVQWDGILLSSLSVPASASNNVIAIGSAAAPSQGIEVWNVKSSYPAEISGGSVTGVDIGVFINNYDGYSSNAGDGAHAELSNISIDVSNIGIRILDNPASNHAAVQLTIVADVSITNAVHGISVENSNASISDLANTSFSTISGNYIQLLANAGDIDATSASFSGVTGATATIGQNFDIEDKILHKIDNASLGLVRVRASELFMTTNSYSAPATTTPLIQRGIQAASVNDILNLRAGNYGRQSTSGHFVNGANGPHQFGMFINKPITIVGFAGGDAACSSADDAAVTFETNATNNFGASGIFVDANNVTIRGLKLLDNFNNSNSVNNNKSIEIDGDAFTMDRCWLSQSTFGSVYFGEWISGTINTYAVTNNRLDNAIISVNNGVGRSGARTQRQITGNIFSGSQNVVSYAIGFRGWDGAAPVQGWITMPVGGAVVTGNTFNQNMENLIWARGNNGGYINSDFDWNEMWTSNTYNTRKVIVLDDYLLFDVRQYVDGGGYPMSRRIGTVIQSSVDLAQTNDVVLVGPGTYQESVVVDLSLDIRGANYGIDPTTGTRSAESVIQSATASHRAFTISTGSTHVGIDGFRFVYGSPMHDGNYTGAPQTSDVTFAHNSVEHTNNIFTGTSTSWRDVHIHNNRFLDVDGTANASAITLESARSAVVRDNVFNNVNYAAILASNVNEVDIYRNEINGTGYQAVQLANAIGSGDVYENVITNANASSGNADRGAIRLYGSAFTGTVSVRNNTISGGNTGIAIKNGEILASSTITITENSITDLSSGDAIYHGGTGTLTATCNWYGSASYYDVNTMIGGPGASFVTYSPWLVNGTDDQPATPGFQPAPSSCTGYTGAVVVFADQSSLTPISVHATIQDAINAATDGNDVRIYVGTYDESPVVIRDVTFRAVENVVPLLTTGNYFVLSTTGLGAGSFENFHATDLATVAVNAFGTINDAIYHVASGGLVLLTTQSQSGSPGTTFEQTVDVGSKAFTLRGLGTSGSDCGSTPTMTIDGGGATIITLNGSSTTSVDNVTLHIDNVPAARYAVITNGSSGNISATNVRFSKGSEELWGLQNAVKPDALADGEDVPEFINDGNDPTFGPGKFLFGDGAPYATASLIAAWKANDADAALINTIYDQSANGVTLSQPTQKNRATRVDDFLGFNGHDAIYFGLTNRDKNEKVLTAKSDAAVVTGAEKTLFVVFRTPNGTSGGDRIIYKHGDDDNGLSLGYTDDGEVQFNIYSDRSVALATHEFEIPTNTTVIAQLYFNGNSTDHRVGASVDFGDGSGDYHLEGFSDDVDFAATTLAAPANYGASQNVAVGALQGETFFDGQSLNTKAPKYTFFNGYIGEIVLLNTADADVRNEVYCYLHNKYDIGNNANGLEKIAVGAEVSDADLMQTEPTVWPNPAQSTMGIAFDVPSTQNVTITVTDILGRTMDQIKVGELPQGRASLEQSVQDLPNGTYSILITGSTFVTSVPFMIQR